MGLFNNREIATAVWLIVLALWLLKRPEIRKSLVNALRAFCHAKILTIVFLMSLYVLGLILALWFLGMWNFDLLKDTIVWFFVGAMVMMFQFATAGDTNILFRKVVADSIKVMIVLEFFVNTYTFPLLIEIVLVPVFSSIMMLDIVASMDKKYELVSKFLGDLQALAGFSILGIAIYRAVSDFQTLRSFDTVRSIALVPMLSIGMLPFLYLMLVVFQYEQLFVRLDISTEKSPQLKRYIRRQILIHAGFRLARLRTLQKHHFVDLKRAENQQDVIRIFKKDELQKVE